MGPTASGKTGVAVELVQRYPFSIISVDSALVYREMDIGTAKPDAQTLAMAPHRLISFLDPTQSYSAAQFRADALREIADVQAEGRIPLLVGGTMLYYRALQRGLADMPSSDASVRAQIDAEIVAYGLAAAHARLARVDPVAAARIHPNDPQRIQRALEVYAMSGIPLSEWIRRAQADQLPFCWVNIAVAPQERQILHQRIAERFEIMLRNGFVNEVRHLRARGDLSLQLPSMRAVGYRQVWEYLDGDYDEATMMTRGVIATRQLAKRQLTWLRSESNIEWIDSGSTSCVFRVIAYIERILAGAA
jgi:tRNA dimethylallyltransferase